MHTKDQLLRVLPEMLELRNLGQTSTQIAAALGAPRDTVRVLLRGAPKSTIRRYEIQREATLEDVAKVLGVSKMTVHSIEQEILRKLRIALGEPYKNNRKR